MAEDENKLSYDSNLGVFHDISPREIVRQVEDLEKVLVQKDRGLRDLMLERDRRYEDRFKAQEIAVTAALSAQKEMTGSAFASSEKAIVKAEEAQRAYNLSHNDLVRKMDEQYKHMMPRSECEKAIDGQIIRLNDLKESIHQVRLEIMKEIVSLRESRSSIEGHTSGLSAGWGYLVGAAAIIAVVVSIIGLINGIPK